MPKLSGVDHRDAIRAFEKLGYRVKRQSKHVIMTDGVNIVPIPRNNPINAHTMGKIVTDVGLDVEEFRKLV